MSKHHSTSWFSQLFNKINFIDPSPFPKRQILDFSKLKEFADDNFGFDSGKFLEKVENTVGKGEIARYKQFLLFPLCLKKTCTADTYKPGLVWERVNNTMTCLVSCITEM